MSTITWLHLSDLHFRAGAQHTWDENIVLEALLEDLDGENLRPDFAVVTGDLAFSGQPAEYELAGAFLDRLLATTGLAKDRLYLVPGNHDVDRSKISFPAQATADALTGRQAANRALGEPKTRQLLFDRFAGYAAFVKSYLGGHTPFDADRYYYVETLELAGERLALLGLNSAWLAAGDEDKGRLLLGERQTRAALRQARDADATLTLALLHHPFEWLADFDRNDSVALLLDRCNFILHGHLHQTSATRLTSPDAEAMVLTCGACYDNRDRPQMYNWVVLDPAAGLGTLYLRRYSPAGGGFWNPDTMTYRNVDDGSYTFAFREAEPGALPAARETDDSGRVVNIYVTQNIERIEGGRVTGVVLGKPGKQQEAAPAAPPTAATARDRGAAVVGDGNIVVTGDVGGDVNIGAPSALDTALASDSGPASGYDLRAVRDLLLAAFTVADLRRLLYYSRDGGLRDLHRRFSGNEGLVDMVEKIIEYCERHLLMDALLSEVQQANPRQYARFADRLKV